MGDGRRDPGRLGSRSLLEPRPQAGQGNPQIAQLTALILAADDHTCGAVTEPDGGLSPIDVLASRSAGAEAFYVALREESLIGDRGSFSRGTFGVHRYGQATAANGREQGAYAAAGRDGAIRIDRRT